jgi:hypothetical protein
MTFWVAGAVVGSAVIGGVAANKAAKTQARSADRAADLQYQQFEQTREDQMPWMEAGKGALNKLIPIASEYTPFGMRQFQDDPGYQFRMSEGMKGLERSAAARGGLLSGGALKGIQRYGQELASQEYQNAFNRYGVERERRLAPLQSLAGLGQTTATQVGQAGQTMASNVGQTMQAGAAARASGYVGQANALTGALNTGLNYYQSQQLMNRMLPQQAPMTYGGG